VNTNSLLLTGGVALASAALATVLRLPAGPLLGAMLGVGILRIYALPAADIPDWGRFVIYTAVGWLLGLSFSAQTPAVLREALVPILVTVGTFLVFGVLLAVALRSLAGLDTWTAVLAAAPGGIAQMGVLAASTGAVVPVVMTVHVLRILSVVLLTSLVFRIFGGAGS